MLSASRACRWVRRLRSTFTSNPGKTSETTCPQACLLGTARAASHQAVNHRNYWPFRAKGQKCATFPPPLTSASNPHWIAGADSSRGAKTTKKKFSIVVGGEPENSPPVSVSRAAEENEMNKKDQAPAPLETTPGQQMDDNIDDLGRGPDGKVQEQPVGNDLRKGKGDKRSER